MAEKKYPCLTDRFNLIFTKLHSSLYSRVGMIVTRVISTYLDIGPLFPIVNCAREELTVYDLQGTKWDFKCSSKFGRSIAYCLYSASELLCVCPSNNPRGAALIDLFTGNETEMCEMGLGRRRPGIIRHRESVYVFGGNISGKYCSCEKLTGERWTHCTEMPTYKFAITPSAYKEDIYLLEGSKPGKSLDIFTPSTNTFLAIPCLQNLWAAVCFIANAELFLVSGDAVRSVNIFALTGDEEHVCACRKSDSAATNSAPLQVGTSVYWASYAGELVRFDLTNRVIIENEKVD